jgi:signal transduction histidine kinase
VSPEPDSERRLPRAAALAAVCGVGLGAAWAFGSPWLIGLDGAAMGTLRAWLFAAGLLAGLLTAAVMARAPSGAGWGLRAGATLGGSGALLAALSTLVLARRLDGAPAAALGLCGVGAAVALALLLALAASATRSPRATDEDSPGAPLRVLVSGACGALAVAAWALASGHLVGQRVTDAERHAVNEARDLVAITAGRLQLGAADELETIAARLAPPGGYLISVDESGRVESGVGVGVPSGALVELDAGPSRCRVARRALPCAVRRLSETRRLIAGVPAAPFGNGVVLAFALTGLLATAVALAIGALVGASPARELDRVSQRLDELARGARGPSYLDRPIVVASLDEVGELTASLNRLRERLEPILTEYRVALDKAQAADQARTEFLSLVSAELRGPLDQLVAAAEALLDPHAEPLTDEQADDVRTVLSAARHLTDLIDEVLDVSAIASGQIILRVGELDLGVLASDVAKTQRPQLQRKGVELRLDVEQPSPRVRGDERRLRQVLTNLITNAVKFTDKGWIEVKVRTIGARIETSVRDTGPGIAPDALPRLFHEFVQLGSLKQRAHGTGLGLAICKRLVEAHGGEVSAESKVGEGSTFRLSVPTGGPPAKEAA